MAFEGLAERLQSTIKNITRKGKLSENDVKTMLREVKLALLEADVNFKVVKKFISNIEERAVGKEIMKSLTPGQQVVKIVQEELTNLMGGSNTKIATSSKTPTVIMMVGLQGTGKTTTSGKLALHLRKKMNRKPLLVAADIYRPAAIKQLQTLGKQLDLPVFAMEDELSPVKIATEAIKYAKEQHLDYVLIDTAGRLHIDEKLMSELEEIKQAVTPTEIFLVADAMTGQDSVNIANSFNNLLNITGVILTKLDGDTRGGAALSIQSVTAKPIKFVGMGEKMDALEPFFPERMASRILGMGDILSLIEKAETNVDAESAKKLEKKLRTNDFTLEDFLEQISQMKKMGGIADMLKMIPGINKMKKLPAGNFDDKQIAKIEAIIFSMTKKERQDASIIRGKRKVRIARGSGTTVTDVNRLLKQFEEMKKMIKQLMGNKRNKKGLNLPF